MRPLLSLISRPPPHLAFGEFPSPLELRSEWAAQLSFEQVFVKRDDLNATGFGGNKVRALEWILPNAGPSVVSMGGYGSTHAAALASYGARTGRRVALALVPQPWNDAVATMLSWSAAHGEVILARSRRGFPGAVVRAWREAAKAGRPSWVPAGGASALGILGSIDAALEFAEQARDHAPSLPDVVVVPLGSGGTAAGLLIGLALARWTIPVCAVAVADRFIANSLVVRWRADRAVSLLGRLGVRVPTRRPQLIVLSNHLGPGYGHPTRRAIEAQAFARRAGVLLDLTYTAKAFGALHSLPVSFRRPCFWHTFDARITRIEGPQPNSIVSQARQYSEALWPFPRSI